MTYHVAGFSVRILECPEDGDTVLVALVGHNGRWAAAGLEFGGPRVVLIEAIEKQLKTRRWSAFMRVACRKLGVDWGEVTADVARGQMEQIASLPDGVIEAWVRSG